MNRSLERGELVLDLFERYYERVYCFIRRSQTPEQAEEIAQELFLRLMEHRNLENLTISVSYLIKVADNLIKRRYRRSKCFQRYLEVERQRHEPELGATIASESHPALDHQNLNGFLDDLSPEERDAVRLIICEGMSYEQAARSLGVSVTTINNWKYRGLRKLKDALREPVAASCP